MKLRPYQEEGRDFLAGRRRALLADEMRVGKTPQAILACDKVGAERILVVCPAIATEHWRREFAKWSPDREPARILDPKRDFAPAAFRGALIASYNVATRLVKELSSARWDAFIPDECHFAKNPNAGRTHTVYGVRGLGWHADRIWPLSGTPARKSAADLWPMLRAFGVVKAEYEDFVAAYCTRDSTGKIIGTNMRMAPELNAMLAGIMLRRTRAMVAPEMPKLDFQLLAVDPTEHPDFGSEDPVTEMSADHLAELRIAIASAKVGPLADNIVFATRNGLLRQTVVFGHHTEPLRLLAEELTASGLRVGMLTGRTPNARRIATQDQFRDGELDVIVGQIEACGTAIDLSAASHGYFLELSWLPSDNVQAASRLISMQKSEPVTIDVVTWPGSFDDKIQRRVARRAQELAALY